MRSFQLHPTDLLLDFFFLPLKAMVWRSNANFVVLCSLVNRRQPSLSREPIHDCHSSIDKRLVILIENGLMENEWRWKIRCSCDNFYEIFSLFSLPFYTVSSVKINIFGLNWQRRRAQFPPLSWERVGVVCERHGWVWQQIGGVYYTLSSFLIIKWLFTILHIFPNGAILCLDNIRSLIIIRILMRKSFGDFRLPHPRLYAVFFIWSPWRRNNGVFVLTGHIFDVFLSFFFSCPGLNVSHIRHNFQSKIRFALFRPTRKAFKRLSMEFSSSFQHNNIRRFFSTIVDGNFSALCAAIQRHPWADPRAMYIV